MRIVVVGGGKVGAYVSREFAREGHTVTVLETNRGRAKRLSSSADLLVINGDGTDVDILNNADVARAEWVLAVTGKDEDNLVACQLSKTLGAANVIARLNDPTNAPTFEALEIPVVAVTDMMVQVIHHEVQTEETKLERVTLLGRGELSLVEIDIPDDWKPRTVAETALPNNTVLVAITRSGEVAIPHGGTEIRPGDRVLIVTTLPEEDDLRAAFGVKP